MPKLAFAQFTYSVCLFGKGTALLVTTVNNRGKKKESNKVALYFANLSVSTLVGSFLVCSIYIVTHPLRSSSRTLSIQTTVTRWQVRLLLVWILNIFDSM